MASYTEALCAAVLEGAKALLPLIQQEAAQDPEVAPIARALEAALDKAREVKAE